MTVEYIKSTCRQPLKGIIRLKVPNAILREISSVVATYAHENLNNLFYFN